MNKKNGIILLLLLVATLPVFAQKAVSGTVRDEAGNALRGASVMVKGASAGTVTDAGGKFSLDVKNANAVISVSHSGYQSKEVAISGKDVLDIVLEPEVTSMDEVAVIGYGTLSKKEVTGAVAQVKSEALQKYTSPNFTDALQGRVAGVSVQASSGAPGAGANVQIRGVGSFSADALSPLYVVDGVPYESDPGIQASDIETVDILKDAASAAIYGTRASNGVILITTKSAKLGKLKVSFNADRGAQKITSGIPMASTMEWLYITQTTYKVGGDGELNYAGDNIGWRINDNKKLLDYNTNWQKLLTNDMAPVSNYNLALNGGGKQLNYVFNAAYFDQEGSLTENSRFRRLTVRGNMNFESGRFDGGIDFNGLLSKDNAISNAVSLRTINMLPHQPPIDLSGAVTNYQVISDQDPNEVLGSINLAREVYREDTRTDDRVGLVGRLGYKITEDLSIQGMASGVTSHDFRKIYNPTIIVEDENGNISGNSIPIADLTDYQRNMQRWMLQGMITYKKSFGNGHNLRAVLVTSSEKQTSKWFQGYAEDFGGSDIRELSAGLSGYNATGEKEVNTLTGLVGRAQYNYQQRYLMSLSVRRDGSSKFGKNNKYATFPSASVGWNIDRESFFKNFSSATRINSLKLRYSYGTSGNQYIKNYSYAAVIAPKVDYVFGAGASEWLALGSIQRNYANENVRWETNSMHNMGIDIGWKPSNRQNVGLVIDVYSSEKRDMLFPVSLPNSTGTGTNFAYQTVVMNVGNMTNRGIEVTGTYQKSGAFSYDLSMIFTKNVNKVTQTNLPTSTIYGGQPYVWGNPDRTTVIRQGYTVGTFFLIPTDGLIRTQEELQAYRVLVPSAHMGDLKYVDTNGDKVIDDNDRVDMGNGTPKFEGGFVFNASYKNIDLNMQWNGAYGHKVFNGNAAYAYAVKTHRDLVYAYTRDNPNTNIPRNADGLNHNNVRTRSNYFLEDGSYIRLRNLQIGYSLPKALLSGMKITNLRFYVAAQNAITITRYTGYDPEVGNDGLLNKGVDSGTYPISAIYRVGVNLNF
ncbi:MAG: TonB-dependent receptor [Niabella sp.]